MVRDAMVSLAVVVESSVLMRFAGGEVGAIGSLGVLVVSAVMVWAELGLIVQDFCCLEGDKVAVGKSRVCWETC